MNKRFAPAFALVAILLILATLGSATATPLDTNRWRNAYPTYYDMDAVAANDIWAVGQNAVIQHYDGSTWSDVASPFDGAFDLRGIEMTSATNGWAVGSGGVIARYSGGAWTADPGVPGLAATYKSISQVPGNPNDIWAVGDSGTIIHYNGSSWVQYPFTQTSASLNGVFMLDANRGWAVGAGVALKYLNGTWSVDYTVGYILYSVYAVAANDVYEVGYFGRIRHYDGSTWTEQQYPPDDLYSVYMLNANEGWAVGSYTLLHYVNGVWTQTGQGSGLPIANTNAVQPNSSNDAWAIGEFGTRLRWNGSSWATDRVTPLIPFNNNMYGVDLTSTSDGWAVGDGGNIAHYGGGENWTAANTTNTYDLRGVDMINSSSGFAVGGVRNTNNGVLLRYNGSAWASDTFPTAPTLRGVSVFVSPTLTLGWAVGNSGKILRYNGSSWQNETSPTTQQLNSVSIITNTEAWAVGDGGTILRYRSSTNSWISFSSPTAQNLNTVRMVSPTDGWAVGLNATILHYDGSSWSAVAAPPGTSDLYGLYVAADGSGWAGSVSGRIYRLNGGTWTRFTPYPAFGTVYAISLAAPNDGWAVGEGGDFIHWFGPPLGGGTPTPTSSPSQTATATITATPLVTATATATSLPPTVTATATPLAPTPTNTSTPLPSSTPGGSTSTATPTPTLTLTPIPTATTTVAPSNTPTIINTPLPTNTPGGPTDTPSSTATITPIPTDTATAAPTDTPTVTNTPLPTNTPGGPTDTPTVTGTAIPTNTPPASATATPPPVATNTPLPTNTPAPAPSPTVTDCGRQFADVPTSHPFYSYIHYLACAGAISGYSDGLFHPSDSATRGQLASIIVRAYGWPIVTPTSGQSFSDVGPANFWFPYVETMAARNVTHGYAGEDCSAQGFSSPCYLPNRNILRSELTRMIVKARNWTIDTTGGPHFSDVPSTYWAYIYIETAYNHGVVSGSGTPPIFRPNTTIRRDELSKIVVLGIINPAQ